MSALQPAARRNTDTERRSPTRQRLADLNAQLAEVIRRSAGADEARAAHEKAKQDEAAATAALHAFVAEEMIADPEVPDRARRAVLAHAVRQARAAIEKTAGAAEQMNDLARERTDLLAQREVLIRLVAVEDGEALAAFYHEHAQQAEAAKEAALRLIRWLNYGAHDPLGAVRIGEALKVAPETPDGALQVVAIKAAIERYADTWSSLPEELSGDPDATRPFPTPLRPVSNGSAKNLEIAR